MIHLDVDTEITNFLPPFKRDTKWVNLMGVLFYPLKALFKRFNDLLYASRLEVALQGRTLVMERYIATVLSSPVIITDKNTRQVECEIAFKKDTPQYKQTEMILLRYLPFGTSFIIKERT